MSDITRVFFVLLGAYFIPMGFGLIVGKAGLVGINDVVEIGKRLTLPLVVRLHERLRGPKQACMREGKWFALCVLIFFNNSVLVAIVERILYGVVFFVPLGLTAWTGFGHGVLFAQPGVRPNLVLGLEFGGYLMAAAVGTHFGYAVFSWLILGQRYAYRFPKGVFLGALGLLALGAMIETLLFKQASSHGDISRIDLERTRKEILERFG